VPRVQLTIFFFRVDVFVEFQLDVNYGKNGEEEKVDTLSGHEGIKVGEVALANAVVHPWTVMVEPVDTAIAEVTVTTAWGADHFAFGAQRACLKLVKHLHKVD